MIEVAAVINLCRAGLDLTLARLALLLYCFTRQGTLQSELAQAVGISPFVMSREAENLVSRGWLRRSEALTDRRQKQLHITERGRRIANWIIEGADPDRRPEMRGVRKSRTIIGKRAAERRPA
jgi:MarR family transcriptional regulator for hemolysin